MIRTPRNPGTVRGVDVRSADRKAGRDVCGFGKVRTETPEIPRDGDVRDEIRRHLLLGAAKFLLWDGLGDLSDFWNLWHGLWNLWNLRRIFRKTFWRYWNLHRIFRKTF